MNDEMTAANRPLDTAGTSDPQEILLVDDTPGEIKLAQMALRDSGAFVALTIARSGEEAVAILKQRVEYGQNPRSCLVLLDLNMRGWDGEETLSQIRRDPSICLTRVVMLTTSSAEGDIERTYGAGANGYVVKPLSFEMMVEFFRNLDGFWAQFIRQPKVPFKKPPRWA